MTLKRTSAVWEMLLAHHAYIAAWKFRVGTGAGGRGGACSVNQPATERAAHCGIRCTVAVALRRPPTTTLSLLGACAGEVWDGEVCGCSGIGTIGSGAGALAS